MPTAGQAYSFAWAGIQPHNSQPGILTLSQAAIGLYLREQGAWLRATLQTLHRRGYRGEQWVQKEIHVILDLEEWWDVFSTLTRGKRVYGTPVGDPTAKRNPWGRDWDEILATWIRVLLSSLVTCEGREGVACGYILPIHLVDKVGVRKGS